MCEECSGCGKRSECIERYPVRSEIVLCEKSMLPPVNRKLYLEIHRFN